MARKRMISPEIWQSNDFSKLSDLAKIIFIGLFSNADDHGYGRCKPGYIRSILFPNDEERRIADIKKALEEIGLHMSVNFYEVEGDSFYNLTNWTQWQKVDKPSKSRIPKPPETGVRGNYTQKSELDEASTNARRTLDEQSPTNRIEENRIERNRIERAIPAREELEAYIKERGSTVNAKRFYDYYSAANWCDVRGNEVKNWKAKVIAWEKNEHPEDKPSAKTYTTEELNARFDDLDYDDV